MKKTYVSLEYIRESMQRAAEWIATSAIPDGILKEDLVIYGLLRGGAVPASVLGYELKKLNVECRLQYLDLAEKEAWKIEKNSVVVDDLIDTGATLEPIQGLFSAVVVSSTKLRPSEYAQKFSIPSYAYMEYGKDEWLVFPWETQEDTPGGMEQAVTALIRGMGEDPLREGLKKTPKRVTKAWKELTEGYRTDGDAFMTVFDSEGYDQMVLLKDIEFHSTCEHHLLPFFGRAHVAYIPNGKIVGISKLARVVDLFARRLQNQERITEQVAAFLNDKLCPKGVAVMIEAQHLCMKSRGVNKQNSVMTTNKMTGVFLENPAARSEFFDSLR